MDNWRKLTKEQKVQYLTGQIGQIQKAGVLLAEIQGVYQRWLKKVQAEK
jgi:hypothetical protein